MLNYVQNHAQKLYLVKVGDRYFAKAIIANTRKKIDIILIGLESVSEKYQFVDGETHISLSLDDLSPRGVVSLDRIIPENIEAFCIGDDHQVSILNPGYQEMINIVRMLQEYSIIGDQMGIYFPRGMSAIKYFPLNTRRTTTINLKNILASNVLSYLLDRNKMIKRISIGRLRDHNYLSGVTRINDNYIIAIIPRNNLYESNSKHILIPILSRFNDMIMKRDSTTISMDKESVQKAISGSRYQETIAEYKEARNDIVKSGIVSFSCQNQEIKAKLYLSVGLSRLLRSGRSAFIPEKMFMAYFNGKRQRGTGAIKEGFTGHYHPFIPHTTIDLITDIPGVSVLYVRETRLMIIYSLRSLFGGIRSKNPCGYWTKILREANDEM